MSTTSSQPAQLPFDTQIESNPEPAESGDAIWERANQNVRSFTPNFLSTNILPSKGPDVICVGAQKAGTTWLYRNISCHPLVCVPPIKEIGYFSSLHLAGVREDEHNHRLQQVADAKAWWQGADRPQETRIAQLELLESLKSRDLSDDWYRHLFSFAEPDQVAMELSPSYSILPRQAMRHMLHLNPNLKIIILLRDPVERIVSHAMMLKSKENLDSGVMDIIASDAFYTLAIYSDYGKWVLRWLGMFGEGRVLIEYLPNIAKRPFDVLQKICYFLGIPFHAGFFNEARTKVFANDFRSVDYHEAINVVRRRAAEMCEEFAQRLPNIYSTLRQFEP